ncbi:MAG: hypothetical protein GY820_05850 [Gammaproteobacteria bacterium]|nr:hypothetical protein [Gammaproteobacteria bacterium]
MGPGEGIEYQKLIDLKSSPATMRSVPPTSSNAPKHAMMMHTRQRHARELNETRNNNIQGVF